MVNGSFISLHECDSKQNKWYTRDTFNYNKVMMKLFILESDDKVLDDLNTAEFDKRNICKWDDDDDGMQAELNELTRI